MSSPVEEVTTDDGYPNFGLNLNLNLEFFTLFSHSSSIPSSEGALQFNVHGPDIILRGKSLDTSLRPSLLASGYCNTEALSIASVNVRRYKPPRHRPFSSL